MESRLGYPIPSYFPFEKSPPLKGWTGRDGVIPDWEQVNIWVEDYPDSNILIRMAPDVIGIDVDHYDGKTGYETLVSIENIHGKLPWTAISSARPHPSGIYWFKLQSYMETDKMRDPGEYIEVIRYEHRYAVAPPSWHPTARARYQWHDRDQVPNAGDLANLPIEWYVHLTRACDCFKQERAQRKMMMTAMMHRANGEAGIEQARKDLEQATKVLEESAVGNRNNMLSSLAGRFLLYDCVINEVLSITEVMDSLMDAALSAGLEKREANRTIESALDWAAREGESR